MEKMEERSTQQHQRTDDKISEIHRKIDIKHDQQTILITNNHNQLVGHLLDLKKK